MAPAILFAPELEVDLKGMCITAMLEQVGHVWRNTA
jgi:hypothetical protein